MGMVGRKERLLLTWGMRAGEKRESDVQSLSAFNLEGNGILNLVSPCWVILNDGVPCVKAHFFSLIETIITDTENSKFWTGSEQLIYESLQKRTVTLIQTNKTI